VRGNRAPTPPRATPSMPHADSERGKEKRKEKRAAVVGDSHPRRERS